MFQTTNQMKNKSNLEFYNVLQNDRPPKSSMLPFTNQTWQWKIWKKQI